MHEPCIAQRHNPTANLAADPLAGDRTERGGLGQGQSPVARRGDDRGGERVLAGALDRSRRGQQVVLGPSPDRQDLDHARPAFGQCAGLVQHQRIDLLEPFERLGRADQHAGPGTLPDTHHDGHRGRQAERAGTGDDQHRDRGDQRIGKRRGRSPECPCRECQQRHGDHRGHEPAGHRVGEPLDGCTRALRLGHHGDDAGEHRRGPHALGAEDEGAGAVDGAADHPVARLLRQRHQLAGHHQLVDGALAFENQAIHRHRFAGPYAQAITRMDGIERDLFIVATSGDAAGGARRQVQQRANGVPGLLARPEFQHLTQQDQDGDHRRGLEIHRDPGFRAEADREQAGSDRGDDAVGPGRTGPHGDQREHVEAAAKQQVPAALEERQAGPQHHRCRKNHLQPVGVEAEMRKHIQRDNRHGERGAHPEAPRHVLQFRIGLGFGADRERLQRHAADRAAAGAGLANLGMHWAGIGAADLGGRLGRRRQVFRRVGDELLAAAGAAEVERAAGLLEAMTRRGGIHPHAADRVGGGVTLRHRGRVVIVTLHGEGPRCEVPLPGILIPTRGRVTRWMMRQSNRWPRR